MVSRALLAVPALIVAAALVAVYSVYLRAPGVGTFHDDGIYLVTAQALAEGDGYRIISLPEEPTQRKYPILFPLLLSIGWRLVPMFPDNVFPLRILPLAAALAWLAASWLLLRRLGASYLGAGSVVVLTAAAPWVVFLSTMVLAETLFAALITAAVLLLTRIERDEGRRFEAFVAGLLMGAAFLTRAAGVAPIAGGFVALASQREWRSCLQYGVGVMVLALPWLWWVSGAPTGEVIDPFYSASNYSTWNLMMEADWREKINVLIVNAIYLSTLGEIWGIASNQLLGHLIGVVGMALVVRGLWQTRSTPVSLIVLFTFAMLLIYVWPPTRFVVPFVPLLAWLAYEGAGRAGRPMLVGLAVVFLVSAAIELWQLQSIVRLKGSTSFSTTSWVFDWYAMKRQIDWIDEHAPKDAVLATIHDPTYYLFTGRKAIRPLEYDPIKLYYSSTRDDGIAQAEDFGRRLAARNVGYVIVTPQDGLERAAQHVMQRAPGSLLPVMGDSASGYVIYRVERDRLGDWARQLARDAIRSARRE